MKKERNKGHREVSKISAAEQRYTTQDYWDKGCKISGRKTSSSDYRRARSRVYNNINIWKDFCLTSVSKSVALT